MQLGRRIGGTDSAKRLGLSIFDEGSRRVPHDTGPWRLSSHQELREHRRAPYLRYLRRHGEHTEADWVQSQAREVDAGWESLDRAMSAGSPHAQSDLWLGLGWATGLLLIKQIVVLLALWAVAALFGRLRGSDCGTPGARCPVWMAVWLVIFLAPFAVVAAIGPDYRWPGSLEAGIAALLIILLGAGWLYGWQRRHQGPGREPAVGATVAVYLLVALMPLVLVTLLAPIYLLWAYCGGVLLVALLAAARYAGRTVTESEAQPGWRPWLVALLAVATTALGAAVTSPLLLQPGGVLAVLLPTPLPGEAGDHANIVPLLVLLPAALLVYFQLLRVAALRLPLRAGLARGLRHTTPYAIALLVVLYLVALVPTVAVERSIGERIARSIAGESL
jgi:hypothetical protein